MEKTLVILAAGMGSRFGGLKQIEPVGPNQEIIADYSVYDAYKVGIRKVIFFKEHITSKYQDKMDIEFAFQSLKNIPEDVHLPKERTKMLGTAHALLACRDLVDGPFIMINSDDFYGQSAYILASKFMEESKDPYEYLTVDYPFYLAKSDSGKVNRGIVKAQDGYVEDINECSIEEVDGIFLAENKKTKAKEIIPKDQMVSLNFFVLKPSIFKIVDEAFNKFIHEKQTLDSELILTDVLKDNIKKKQIKFKEEASTSSWLGVTYKEDLKIFKDKLRKMIEEGEYPRKLWK